MPNCDFGRPCSCRDCRTVQETITCPECAFPNTVRIEQDWTKGVDRKGMTFIDFVRPTTPKKDLVCYQCAAVIKDVDYFTARDDAACEHKVKRLEAELSGKGCSKCGKLEGIDFVGRGWAADIVQLAEDDGEKLCQACLSDRVKARIPDPSSSTEKFTYDRRAMVWKLEKVRVACDGCGKQRWLNAENAWKKKCSSCYFSVHR